MKATYKNKETEKMMKAIKGANTSLLTISKHIIDKALLEGDLEDMGKHVSSLGNENHYYAITSSSNDVLMKVQGDMYCIINRTVDYKGKQIDLINELLKCSWYANATSNSNNRCHVVAHTPEELQEKYGHTSRLYLHRFLVAMEMFGEPRYLDPSCDVHHKGDCYDNRQDLMMYIKREDHKHKNHHMTGGEIRSYEALLQHFDYLAYTHYKLKDVTTVH